VRLIPWDDVDPTAMPAEVAQVGVDIENEDDDDDDDDDSNESQSQDEKEGMEGGEKKKNHMETEEKQE